MYDFPPEVINILTAPPAVPIISRTPIHFHREWRIILIWETELMVGWISRSNLTVRVFLYSVFSTCLQNTRFTLYSLLIRSCIVPREGFLCFCWTMIKCSQNRFGFIWWPVSFLAIQSCVAIGYREAKWFLLSRWTLKLNLSRICLLLIRYSMVARLDCFQ